MITTLSRDMQGPEDFGFMQYNVDVPIVANTRQLSGPSIGRYVVPAGKKTILKSLAFNFRRGPIDGNQIFDNTFIGMREFGRYFYKVNGVTIDEFRVNGATTPGSMPYDESDPIGKSANQSCGYGEGFVVPAGQALTVEFIPAYTSCYVTRVTLVGKMGSTPVIQQQRAFFTFKTTAQVVFSYTPASDMTLLALTENTELGTSYMGQFSLDVDGNQIYESPPFGIHREGSSVAFSNDGYAGPGMGIFTLPLWNIPLYEGESISGMLCPLMEDESRWQIIIAGDEQNLSVSGGSGMSKGRVVNAGG